MAKQKKKESLADTLVKRALRVAYDEDLNPADVMLAGLSLSALMAAHDDIPLEEFLAAAKTEHMQAVLSVESYRAAVAAEEAH